MKEDFRFKVNLGGMIEILSDHLYSSPDVYIRELLQNAVDAITGRKKWMEEQTEESLEAFEGAITLEIEEGSRLVFADNGQGLMEEEIHRFLAIIGESSKRSLENGRIQSDYIGRFGIGLLSCFMVSEEIRMITKSCRQKQAPVLEWCGKPDGTYSIREVTGSDGTAEEQKASCEEMDAPGTKVVLFAKPGMEEYFTREKIEKLIVYYGMLLPYPILLRQRGETKQLNPTYFPWEDRTTNKQELMLFGKLMFQEQFLDCMTFCSKEGNVTGVAYILNYSVLPSAKISHRIYLKNMLLTENGNNLLPEWAVFTKCIINATDLRPTASREGFYVDEVLEAAKEAIEDAMIAYIADMAENRPELFKQFFRMHHLTLMSLALATPKLFGTLIDYFEFETTRGRLTGYDLRTSGEALVYAPTEAKYKQLSQLFFAQNQLLINVSYVHSLDLLLRMGEVYEIPVHAVEDWSIEDLMRDLSPEDADECFDFRKKANRILKNYDCKAELKYFSPYHQPTFYFMDEQMLLNRQIAAAKAKADSMFFHMLDAFAADISNEMAATLYFNYNNPVVKKMVGVEQEDLLKILIEIFYVQALQIGGFSLHNNELSMQNRNILALMERGLSDV